VATGESGSLTITLEGSPVTDFGGKMDYSLIGTGFSAEAGVTVIFNDATSPFSITETVPINSATFGLVYVGAIITDLYKVVETPVTFKIKFSLSAPATE
jgi:hypothetical protein